MNTINHVASLSLSIFQNHRQISVTKQKQYKCYNNYNKSTIDHQS